MNQGLQLSLLGKPEIRVNGQDSGLVSIKPRGLLFYLALQSGPVARSTLAGIFWGDKPETVARANLRTALSQLRQHIGECLSTRRQTVAFNPACNHTIDVVDFEAACREEAVPELRRAVDMFRGDFLEDFAVPDSLAFEEWVSLERERLRRLVLEVLDRLVDDALAQADWKQAIQEARRALALEPWRERSHRQLILALANNGERSAALAQFEACRRLLAEELDVTPSAETLALVARLKTPEAASVQPPQDEAQRGQHPDEDPPPRHNLPAPTTPFIGRADELAQSVEVLASSAVRLLTVIGPGGIGKTRLALSAAWRLLKEARFQDGVYFVPLADADGQTALITAIASAIDLPFTSQLPPQTQLVSYLKRKHMLLVLDNFEHLTGHAGWLVELLENSPRLSLMITSRTGLNLYEEGILELGGLPEPEAVQLFAQRARRASLGFDLGAEKPAVTGICQLLLGVPLAIELAAAWVRTLSCADIASEIQSNLDFLSGAWKNVPDRQHSLRATFVYSWQLLSPREQSIFQKLCLFRGGFSRTAAAQVAEASLRDLSLLVNKSLVQRGSNGRYTVHELLRQYGLEEIGPAEIAGTQARHGRYFARYVGARATHIAQFEEQQALADLTLEIENLREAWKWALSCVETDPAEAVTALGEMIHFLAYYFYQQGWYQDGQRLFTGALEAMQTAGWHHSRPEFQLLVSQARARLARIFFFLGEFENSRSLLEQSLADLAEHTDPSEKATVLGWLGANLFRLGQFGAAEEALHQSLHLFRAQADLAGEAYALNSLGALASSRGDYDQAMAYDLACLEIYRRTGYERGLEACLNNIGSTYGRRGEPGLAQSYYEEALSIARRINYPLGIMSALSNNGSNARQRGDHAQAEAYYRESLALAREWGDRRWVAVNLDGLGASYLGAGDLEAARAALVEGLQEALTIRSVQDILNILASVGQLFLQQGRPEEARLVLNLILVHPAAPRWSRDQAERLWQVLEKQYRVVASSPGSEDDIVLETVTPRIMSILQKM